MAHSVLLDGAQVIGIERLEDSIIGRESTVVRDRNKHQALRLMIGDDAEVRL